MPSFHNTTSLCLLCSTLLCAAPASAQTFEGEDGRKVTFYGQLNLVLQSYDDGRDSEQNIADSGISGSRFGFNYDIPISDNRLRFRFETGFGLPRSDNFEIGDGDDFDWRRTDLRKFEVIYSGDRFGALSLGQGSMATDGLAGLDVSGTSIVATPDPTDLAGNYEFRTTRGDLSGIELDNAFGDFDGPRRFRARYNTPDFAGFSVGVAYGEEVLQDDNDSTFYDIALRYENETEDYEIVGGFGYLWEDVDDGDTEEQFVASGGVLLKNNGISFNAALGDEQDGGRYYWLQVGWEGDLIAAGSTSFSLDYWDGSDFNVEGSDSDAITLAAVQRFDDVGVEAYAAYRTYSYDDSADAYQDGDLIIMGARWRF